MATNSKEVQARDNEKRAEKKAKQKSNEQNGKGRTRNFATVIYPESAPENWKEILAEMRIQAFISPLHEFDTNPDGEIKKPHWHVIAMYDGVKTDEQAKEVFNKICGVGLERINSIRGYARYLCHLDNPEKHQYSVEQVKCLAGADYISVICLVTDKYTALKDMTKYIEDNNIMCFADLYLYAMNERDDWFRILCDSGTYVIKEFLKSRKWRTETQA